MTKQQQTLRRFALCTLAGAAFVTAVAIASVSIAQQNPKKAVTSAPMLRPNAAPANSA
ncbi:MAG TPA: hypothetical protein VJN21_02865 [Candidatus Acidoferrales bacterium]|nr:hypothetical protein [Candidatus Acidoferrales bacterium]